MDGVWEVGPFIVKQSLLVVILIVIIGFYLAHQLLRENESESKTFTDLFWNGILLFVIVFQFSSLLVYFSTSVTDPLASLAMPSGSIEWMLAWVCLIFYLFWKTNQKRIDMNKIVIHIMISYLVIETIYFAFFPYMVNGYPTSLIQMVINVGVIIFYYWKKEEVVKRKLIHLRIIVVYGFMLGTLSLINSTRMMTVVVPSWFYFIIGFAAFIILTRDRSWREKET